MSPARLQSDTVAYAFADTNQTTPIEDRKLINPTPHPAANPKRGNAEAESSRVARGDLRRGWKQITNHRLRDFEPESLLVYSIV